MEQDWKTPNRSLYGKRRYISFKVEEDIEDAATTGPVREPWRVRCGRCMRFTGFCLVCTGTLFQALAPWMLSVIEVVGLLLLLLLLIRHPPGPYGFHINSSLEDVVLLGILRAAALSSTYAWASSNNRFMLYLVTSYIVGVFGFAYAVVKAYCFMYPVIWIPPAALMATFALFSCMHILAARHTVAWARRRGQLGLAPFEALGALRYSSSASSLAGLADGTAAAGAGSPSTQWLTGEDVPAELLADVDSQFMDIGGVVVHYKQARPAHWSWAPGEAQPPQQHMQTTGTAAASSHAEIGFEAASTSQSLYRQHQQAGISAAATGGHAAGVCLPAAGVSAAGGSAAGVIDAVVFVHGFGGGVFSWRHMMAPLAAALGVRVIALDRPGFGLTSRPQVEENTGAGIQTRQQQQQFTEPLLETGQQQQPEIQYQTRCNPYTTEAQASLVLKLCAALGLKRVVLVGHADGCLVVLHAAAAATRSVQVSRPGAAQTGGSSSSNTGSEVLSANGHSGRRQPASQQQQQQQQRLQGRHHSLATPHDDMTPVSSAAAGEATVPDITATGPGGDPIHSLSLPSSPVTGSYYGQQQQQAEQCHGVALRPPQPAVATPSPPEQCDRSVCNPVSERKHSAISVSQAAATIGGVCSSAVCVWGVVLCGPHLSGHVIQPFTRLLAGSSLGRNIIRPLLRSQVGDVRSRGSWYSPELITPEVLQLYRTPLHVEGWDAALLACSKATASVSSRQVEQQLQAIRDMPVLIVTGEADRIAPVSKLSALTALLRNSRTVIMPHCGHLLHEEAPAELAQLLRGFCVGGHARNS